MWSSLPDCVVFRHLYIQLTTWNIFHMIKISMHFSNISLQQEQNYIFNSFSNLDNVSFSAFYVYLLLCLFFFSVHILFFLVKLHFIAFCFVFVLPYQLLFLTFLILHTFWTSFRQRQMSTVKSDLHFCVLQPAISICNLLFFNICQKVVNVVGYIQDGHCPSTCSYSNRI